MNNKILVEFVSTFEESERLEDLLISLDEEFIQILDPKTGAMVPAGYFFMNAMCDSDYATMIKLQEPFLADRMRISYISNELKNKYRK